MRVQAVNVIAAALVLSGSVASLFAAWSFTDANDIAGAFWGTLAAAMLAAAVRMAGRR